MSTGTTSHVRKAIMRTKEHDPEYFKKCIEQRLMFGKGSFYLFTDPAELEEELMRAVWCKYDHPNIAPGCHGYITYSQRLSGYIGLVPLAMVPSDTKCYLKDPKGCGKLSLCMKPINGDMWPVNYTVLITGDDGYGQCMFTFHPGDPIKPSTLSADGNNELGLKDGDVITAKRAIELGFKHAKIDREAGK